MLIDQIKFVQSVEDPRRPGDIYGRSHYTAAAGYQITLTDGFVRLSHSGALRLIPVGCVLWLQPLAASPEDLAPKPTPEFVPQPSHPRRSPRAPKTKEPKCQS